MKNKDAATLGIVLGLVVIGVLCVAFPGQVFGISILGIVVLTIIQVFKKIWS